MMNEETESLQVLVAKHLKELSKKQTFEAAAGALTSLVQERYATATPAEQNAVCPYSCRFFFQLHYACENKLILLLIGILLVRDCRW